MTKVSIVIPFIHEYPNLYGTVNALQAYAQASELDFEIIVAENGTMDPNTPKAFTGDRALYRAIMGGDDSLLKYVFEIRQCGPIARNTGARIASGDYVMFMDAHTTPGLNAEAPNSIEALVEVLEDNPDVGGVSGLTAWSHYDYMRLGSFYELFHTPEKRASGKGGPSLRTHMHGHYMAIGHIPRSHPQRREITVEMQPFDVVMGSQAYTMYRLDEFLKIGGYFEGARFYPHPEGYMPLKMWMTGKRMVVHPKSWHIHGMYPRTYAASPVERDAKIKEYGGYSWQQHFQRNVMMIALILGGEKWMKICHDAHWRPNLDWLEEDLVQSAVSTVESQAGELEWFYSHREMTLDEVLTMARRERILGMEKWYDGIGSDPL